MPSTFDQLFSEVAVPRLVDQFGERASDGAFVPVSIRLDRSQQPFPWPEVVVGDLTARLIEVDGRIEQREACNVHGPTDSLVTGSMPLPELTQVTVPKYGDMPFQPFMDECKFGGPMTSLSLVRVPVRTLDNFHEQRGA